LIETSESSDFFIAVHYRNVLTDLLTSGTTGQCVPVYFPAFTGADIVEIDTASL